jgi:flagellar biosynthetic protein FlhB
MGQEIAMNQMLGEVAKADVVIVNPTHFAVALKWDKSSRAAPVVVAKGVDEMAAKIRALAREASVPIQSDPPAARMIYATVKLGESVLPEHYKAVAVAIRFAEALQKRKSRS